MSRVPPRESSGALCWFCVFVCMFISGGVGLSCATRTSSRTLNVSLLPYFNLLVLSFSFSFFLLPTFFLLFCLFLTFNSQLSLFFFFFFFTCFQHFSLVLCICYIQQPGFVVFFLPISNIFPLISFISYIQQPAFVVFIFFFILLPSFFLLFCLFLTSNSQVLLSSKLLFNFRSHLHNKNLATEAAFAKVQTCRGKGDHLSYLYLFSCSFIYLFCIFFVNVC